MYRRLKDLREDRDLTQKDIADYLSLTHSAYARIERGERALTAEVLIKLSIFYDVNIDYILGQCNVSYRLKNIK